MTASVSSYRCNSASQRLVLSEPFDRKWPNNNARIEKYNSWPWKLPFQEHRCVLPLSEFREPCYWGETAGSEVYFKAESGEYLGVAGLYNVWKSQGTEKFYTMTFLMRPASKYVMEHGHHRQPFFIEEAWLRFVDGASRTRCERVARDSPRVRSRTATSVPRWLAKWRPVGRADKRPGSPTATSSCRNR